MNRQYHYLVSYKNSKRLLQNLQHTTGDYFISPHPVYNGQISPNNFKQNKSYITFSESTHCFLMVQKHVTQQKVTKNDFIKSHLK